MWVRGLKQNDIESAYRCYRSHPMWVRGLKPVLPLKLNVARTVAPHVGAWIETMLLTEKEKPKEVAPHVGAWIETASSCSLVSLSCSRTPCGCVD